MSGLWTPGGDKNPENNTNTETSQEAMSQAEMSVPDDAFEGMSEEEKTQALEQITKMRAELLETPSRDIIGNHIVGFYELATVHLSDATTLEGKAREDRLAAALSQLQMAFTQVRNDDAVVNE